MKIHNVMNQSLTKYAKTVIGSAVVAASMISQSVMSQSLEAADAARMAGQQNRAQVILEQLIQQSEMDKQTMRAKGMLAAMLMTNLEFDEAAEQLRQAREVSTRNEWDDVTAELANYQGLYFQKLGQRSQALDAYNQSRTFATRAGLPDIEHQAILNIGLLHEQSDDQELAKASLSVLTESLQKNSSANAAHWLGAGKLALNLSQANALELLQQGLLLADEQKDVFSQSIAYGYLGHLYELAGKSSDAINLTDKAMNYAVQGDFGNLMVQWEWQRGRLFADQGDNERALSAFRRAVIHVEANRQDIPVEYSGGRSSFRETLGPLYADLSRSLIDNASGKTVGQQQALYKEARQSIELIKRTELEDYFNNRCALSAVDDVVLDDIGQFTASLYPIIFDDRLDLLVSINGNISHHTVDVNRATLSAYATTLATNLREKKDFSLQAQKLYEWLVAPVEAQLKREKIQTVVFLPDSVLRLIPLGMLNSGQNYLIEDYAVVTSPGLSIFDPQKTDKRQYSALLAGMSTPGNVVKDLPNDVLGSLLPDSAKYRDMKTRALDAGTEKVARSLSGQALLEMQQALSIPGVEREVDSLARVMPAKTLLNEGFTKATLVNAMVNEPFKVVHIASHGVFGNSAENSFIMAHDQIISMNELETILYSDKFKDQPIELITLSACQTAEGDDRAPLGISGVALQAKVRSALGSLWSISDEGTVKFMELFYANLMTGSMTKSEAVRRAQIEMSKDDRFAHPYYWSPFVLIGNWL